MRRPFFLILFLLAFPFASFADFRSVPGLQDETVTHICQDHNGYTYISTLRGIYCFDGKSTFMLPGATSNYSTVKADDSGMLWASNLSGICRIKDGVLCNISSIVSPVEDFIFWDENTIIGASQYDGLFTMDMTTGQCEVFYPDSEQRSSPIGQFRERRMLQKAADGSLWYVLESTAIVFDSSLNSVRRISINPDEIWLNGICSLNSGQMLIATPKGIFSYGIEQNADKCYMPDENILFVSDELEGYIIMGVAGLGIHAYNKATGQTVNILPEEKLHYKKCIASVSDSKYLWLSPDNAGVIFHTLDMEEDSFKSLIDATLHKYTSMICEDSWNNIWTLSNGRLYRHCKATGATSEIILPMMASSKIVEAALITKDDRLFVIFDGSTVNAYELSMGGLKFAYSLQLPGKVANIRTNMKGDILFGKLLENQYRLASPDQVVEDSQPIQQVNSRCGAAICKDTLSFMLMTAAGEARRIADVTSPSIYVSFDIMYLDNEGFVWIIRNFSQLEKYSTEGALVKEYPSLDNKIFSVVQDKHGRHWIGSENGLIMIDGQDGKEHIRHFNSGRKFDYFTLSFEDSDGMLYFAYSNGITIVNPDDLSSLTELNNIPFLVKYVSANGEYLAGGNVHGGWNISDKFNSAKEIRLPHKYNTMTFGLSYISYDLLQTQKLYMLKGYDDGWRLTGQDEVTYTKLPKGKYTFMYKLSGMDDADAKSFTFRIKPSPLDTTAAHLAYMLALIAAAYGAWKLVRRRMLAEELQREQRALSELNTKKINFFTNISHEFRTPLSLIYAPLQDIASEGGLPESTAKKISIISRNVKKLMLLSNRLLEYNNLDIDSSKLELTQADIVDTVAECINDFRYAASENNISIKLEVDRPIVCGYDATKINRIMSNLLSNALKYSNAESEITVRVETLDSQDVCNRFGVSSRDGAHICISVLDQGIGIPEDKLDIIFNRYQRIVTNNDIASVGGYGIGLHYTKQLVEAHEGVIKAEKNTPKGSIFSFAIPVAGDAATIPAQQAEEVERHYAADEEAQLPDLTNGRGTLLIIDDNRDMLDYLQSLFEEKFAVQTAENGSIGLEMLKTRYHDIVICDVMMPGISGYDVCTRIKEDDTVCGTPVILLTAKSEMESQIHGLKSGADAYVTKPFDPEYIKAMVESILANRRLSQKKLASRLPDEPDKLPSDSLSDLGKEFLNRLYSVIDKNLSNEAFSMQDLAQELGLSYSNMYLKCRNMFGMSPVQFLNKYRMNKAERLLTCGRYNVNEVADMLGFGSSDGFSRTFKKEFGVGPKQYQLSHSSES